VELYFHAPNMPSWRGDQLKVVVVVVVVVVVAAAAAAAVVLIAKVLI